MHGCSEWLRVVIILFCVFSTSVEAQLQLVLMAMPEPSKRSTGGLRLLLGDPLFAWSVSARNICHPQDGSSPLAKLAQIERTKTKQEL